MIDVTADEIDRIDQAFGGNRLLSILSSGERALIEPFGAMVELETGELVADRGDEVEAAFFPVGQTLISVAVEASRGRTIEVGLIGSRGAVGGIVSCGQAPAFGRAVVLVGGSAFRLPMPALEDAKRRSPFVVDLLCRFADFLLAQAMQSVACNAFHSIPERAARWLLHAQDRTGDRIELTQQALAGLLGAQRTTVNAVSQSLEREGLITTGRGVIRVVDRAGLMRRSCECYRQLEDHYAVVIETRRSG